jgi:hypothetical protein
MKKIRLLKPFGTKAAGDVLDAYPQSAATLIAGGVAEEATDGNIKDDSGSENIGIERVGESDTLPSDERPDESADRDYGVDSLSGERRGRVK